MLEKTYIWFLSTRLKWLKDPEKPISTEYHVSNLLKEMTFLVKDLARFPSGTNDDNRKIKVRFQDRFMFIPVKELYALRSHYINNLLEVLGKNEIFEGLSDISSQNFRKLTKFEWERDVPIAVMEKIDSAYFYLVAKNLFYKIRHRIDLTENISKILAEKLFKGH